MNQMQEHHFAVGMTVYDTVGYTIGKLHAYNPQGRYLTVRTGGLFHGKGGPDRYIPMDAVDHSGATGGLSFLRNGARRDISLLLSRDDLKAEQYSGPPTGGTNSMGTGGDDQSATTPTRAPGQP